MSPLSDKTGLTSSKQIDWDRFLHFSGYGTIGSAKKTMQNTKKEIKELLEKAGMNNPNGNGNGDGGGGDNDDATAAPKPKKSVKPKPQKRKAADTVGEPAKKKGRGKGGFKAVNKEEVDDEADIFGELIKNDKSAAADSEDVIKDEEPVASAPEEFC